MIAEQRRRRLCACLRRRRNEIVEAVWTRVSALSATGGGEDPIYRDGLELAVAAAVDFGIASLARGPGEPLPIPTALLAQARLAARYRVGLDTVLRRYVVGHRMLGDFILEEIEGDGATRRSEVKALIAGHADLLDRVLTEVTGEYGRETSRPISPTRRRAELVRRTLEGETPGESGLEYDFDSEHLAFVALGPGAEESARALAGTSDARTLIAVSDNRSAWVWISRRERMDREALADLFEAAPGASIGVGAEGSGLSGWRRSHRQARAAVAVGRRRGAGAVVTFYEDVALVAAVLRDEDFASFLTDTYLAPLASERDGGLTLRSTLRAYFAAGQNVSSAAAALGVGRQTVTNRLRAVEERVGRSITGSAAELEASLLLSDLWSPRSPES
jgi:hypothetical protein